MRASARFFWITTERQQSQRVRRSTPSTVTLFQRVPWQISQSIALVQIAAQDAVLADHVQIASVGFAALARLAQAPAAALVVEMRGKILRIRDGRLLDLSAGGSRLRVFERDANRIDEAALDRGGQQSRRGRFGGPAGLGKQVHHRLSHPPQRRRLKIRARWIVSSSRFDQSEVAFVNQLEQRHAEPAKALRVSDDHAQVGLHETAERNLIALLMNETAQLLLVITSD